MEYIINTLHPHDWESIRAIYEQGMATGLATFETRAPGWEEWDAGHLLDCRLAARHAEKLVGWAALGPISKRQVYRGVAEVSLYIAAWARGQGIGRHLMFAMIDASEQAGIWTLQSTIFAINNPSLKLHLACGFREVGRRERIAQRDGIWHDTIVLERRSQVVGN